MIKVQKIAGKERGIIATKDISQGMLLETAPVAAFPAKQRLLINQTEVSKYYFVIPAEYAQGENVKGYFVFGLASLCNHREEPNSYVDWIEDEVGLWSHLIAKKDIRSGEEITLFYTNIDEYIDAQKFV